MFRDLLSGDAPSSGHVRADGGILGAPIVAPFIGGLVLLTWSWRAIFVLLAGISGLMFLAACAWLPETLPPELRRSMDIGTVVRGYVSIARSPDRGRIRARGRRLRGRPIRLPGRHPFIYIDYYGLEERWFGALFGVAVLGAWLAQGFNIRYIPVSDTEGRSGWVDLPDGTGRAALVADTNRSVGLAGVVAASTAVLSMVHLVTPGTQAGVLDDFPPDLAGSASAFSTFVRFTLGAAGSAAVGLFNDGTPKAYGIVVLACAAMTLFAASMAQVPRTVPRPDRTTHDCSPKRGG